MDKIYGRMDIAMAHGIDVAIFIDNLRYWSEENAHRHENFIDGRYWIYYTLEGFSEMYPIWSRDQIKRIIVKCKNAGLLLTADYNDNPYKRTKWYSLSDEALNFYDIKVTPDGQWLEPHTKGRNRHVDGVDAAKSTKGEIATFIKEKEEKKEEKKKDPPCSPPAGDAPAPASEPEDKPAPKPKGARREKSAPAHDPEAFETFWAKYPRKDDRKAAIRAWDKLKPDKPLCRTMYAALKRQRGSEQWAEEGGKYIPLFSTWLNGRKWENQGVDLSLLTGSRDPGGGWAPDPEVTS